MVKSKKKEKTLQPQCFVSTTNIPTYNYKVYYMSHVEKIIYFILAFIVGAAIGYLFYGGIGKDEFGDPTTLTYLINNIVSCSVGCIAGYFIIPIRTKQIIDKQRRTLNSQFRDMLEAFNTSLGAGKNVVDSFLSVNEDLKIQYEEDAFILKELDVIIAGMNNNVDIEDLLFDFGERSGIDDIKSFANVFKICYRKGGNIKETIRSTHDILSDKMEINEDIETVVTSNKTEQNVMVIMPIVLIGIIKVMSPEFAENFTTFTGIISTTIALGLFVVSYIVGRAVLNIKV